MPIPDLQTLIHKLSRRGFRPDDGQLHECVECKERAVLSFLIAGRSGGRDIKLCQACGGAWSWRSVPGLEAREADPSFDLRAFLG